MRTRRLSLMLGLALLAVAANPREARAIPLTPFRSEAQAPRYCPSDVVVWLDFAKGIYYAKRQKRYGRGFDGSLSAAKRPAAVAIGVRCWGCDSLRHASDRATLMQGSIIDACRDRRNAIMLGR